MPAVYIPYAEGGKDNIFSWGGGGGTPFVKIEAIDGALNSGLAIYTSVTVTVNETVQYLLTLGNSIRYIDFGKGLGVVNVNGTIFTDCSSSLASAKFFSIVNPLKGTVCAISMMDYSCNAVLMSATVEIVAEPDTMANFSLYFNIVNDNSASNTNSSGTIAGNSTSSDGGKINGQDAATAVAQAAAEASAAADAATASAAYAAIAAAGIEDV